jgi:hypothetical protein
MVAPSPGWLDELPLEQLQARARALGIDPRTRTRLQLCELLWNRPTPTLRWERTHGETT